MFFAMTGGGAQHTAVAAGQGQNRFSILKTSNNKTRLLVFLNTNHLQVVKCLPCYRPAVFLPDATRLDETKTWSATSSSTSLPLPCPPTLLLLLPRHPHLLALLLPDLPSHLPVQDGGGQRLRVPRHHKLRLRIFLLPPGAPWVSSFTLEP